VNARQRAFSSGGGWQSTAALVLAAEGKIDYRTFVFCNVGDDSENPGTLAYLDEHAIPYAQANGLEFVTLRKMRRGHNGPDTILEWVGRSQRSIPIPVRMANGAPGNRSCSETFKIKVVASWARQRGGTAASPVVIGIGFTVDEISRVGGRPPEPGTEKGYPLLDLGIRRSDCPGIIRRAGLPMPPKSSCWFCPEHRIGEWLTQREERPDLFARACDLEAQLIERRAALGKDPVYFTRRGKPLADAIAEGVTSMISSDGAVTAPADDDGACETGYCFT
jgi:hypothetical protein